jgi:hypothetical protein
MLKFIKASSPLPWLCIGDFNEVLLREEHMGVNERSNAQIQAFRDTVDICELMDLGYMGTSWTFEKKVAGGSYCRVRLDRALASASWSARFPLATLQHLTAAASDHSPILLRQVPMEENTMQPRLFRYETMWESHQELKPVIEQMWQSEACTTMQGLERKLKSLSGTLTTWGRDTFGSVRHELKILRSNLEAMRSQPCRVGPSYEEIKTVERIVELQHREEVMWRQRSRIQWLSEGDRNTRFFHMRASMRKKKTKLSA